jgi:hypothetical protein
VPDIVLFDSGSSDSFSSRANSLARHGPKPRRSPDCLNGVDTLPETRSRPGSQLEHRLRRWRSAALPIAQGALAAGLSWLIAVHIAGHCVPFFAPVAAVVCPASRWARDCVASSN